MKREIAGVTVFTITEYQDGSAAMEKCCIEGNTRLGEAFYKIITEAYKKYEEDKKKDEM